MAENNPFESLNFDVSNKTSKKATGLAAKKTEKLGNLTGFYDADSAILGGKTGRLNAPSGEYFVQSPELKDVAGNLTQEGIAARIQADNFAMGVDAPNLPPDFQLSDEDYALYKQHIDPSIEVRGLTGQYVPTSLGKKDYYGRPLYSARSEELPIGQTDYLLSKGQGTRQDVYGKGLQGLNFVPDTDSYVGEAVDAAQSSMVRWWGQTGKTLGKVTKSVATNLGVDEKTASEWVKNNMGKSGLFEGKRFEDLAKQEVADKIAGVRTDTRQDFQLAQQQGIKDIEESKYGSAIFGIVQNLPMFLADSTGEMLSLATLPTAAITIANRTSEQAEEYEKNNGEAPSSAWIIGSLASDAVLLFGERLIIGKGIKDILAKGSTISKKAKELGTTMGFEAVQEAGEEVKETAFTQKGAFTPEAEQSLAEITTSPESQFAALSAAASAGALKGAGDVAGAALSGKEGVIDKTKEFIDKRKVAKETDIEQELDTQEAAQAVQADANIIDIEETYARGDLAKTNDKIQKAMEDYSGLNSDIAAEKKQALKTVVGKIRADVNARVKKIIDTKKVDAKTLRAVPESEDAILDMFLDLETDEEITTLSDVLAKSDTLKGALGEKLNTVIAQAKEDRVNIKEIQDAMEGSAALETLGGKNQKGVRKDVIKEGLAFDKLGAIAWYKMAKSDDKATAEKGIANLERFATLEEEKSSNLEAGLEEAKAELRAHIKQQTDTINSKGQGTITEKEMLEAQLFLERSPISNADDDTKRQLKQSYEKFANLAGFTAFDKKANANYEITGEPFKVPYGTSTLGRNEGVFELNKFETWLDLAKEDLDPGVYKGLNKESSVTNLITAIGREVEVMTGLQNKLTSKDVEEVKPTEVVKEPTKEAEKPIEIVKEPKVEKPGVQTVETIEEARKLSGTKENFFKTLQRKLDAGETISTDIKDYSSTVKFTKSMNILQKLKEDKKPHPIAVEAEAALVAHRLTTKEEVKAAKVELTKIEKELSELKKRANSIFKDKEAVLDTINGYQTAINELKIEKAAIITARDVVFKNLDKTKISINRQEQFVKKYMGKIDDVKVQSKDTGILRSALNKLKKSIDLASKKAIIQVRRFLTRVDNLRGKLKGFDEEIDILEDKLYDIDEKIGKLYAERDLKYEGLKLKTKKVIHAKKEQVGELKARTTGTDYSQELITEQAYGVGKGKQKLGNKEFDVSIEKLVDVNGKTDTSLSSVPIEALDSAVLNKVGKQAEDVLSRLIPLAGKGNTGAIGLTTDTGRGLLLTKDGKGYDKNVVMAMTTALAEEASVGASKYQKMSNSELERVYGLSEGEGDVVQLALLGVPKKFVANTLGQAIMNNLGLRMKKDADEFVYEKLTQSLGQAALLLGEKVGYWNINSIPTTELSKLLGRDARESEATSEHVVISEDIDTKKAKKVFEAVSKEIEILENVKGVRFSTRDTRNIDLKIRRNDRTVAPKDVKDTVKDYINTKYELNTEAVDTIRKLGKGAVQKLLGYKSKAEIVKMGYRAQKSAESVNNEIDRNLESLVDVHNLVRSGEENNELYFDWFIARNGRMMMDSAGFNPQSKKLHRSIVNTEQQTGTVTKENEHVFKLAIAQAFGFDIDKEAISDSTAFADAVLAEPDLKNKVTAMMKDGQTSMELSKGSTLEIHELGHSTVAMLEADKYISRDKSKPFKTKLTVEADALTSGFGLKMLQMPLGEDVNSWLAKAGIFVGGKPDIWKDMPMAEILTKIEDSYKTLAKDMGTAKDTKKGMMDLFDLDKEAATIAGKTAGVSNVKRIFDKDKVRAGKLFDLLSKEMPELVDIDKQVTKAGRNIFKGPFMTFNYGAGFAKIKQELTYTVQDELIQKMVDGELDSFIGELVGKQKVNMFKKKLKTTDTSKIPFKKGYSFQELLNVLIGESYGNRIQDVLSSKFTEVIAVNNNINNSLRIMFRMYKKAYDEIANDKYEGRPTSEESMEIFESLRDIFPIIRAPLGKDKKDGIAVYKSAMSDEAKLKYGDIQTRIYDDNRRVTSKNVQSVLRTIEEAGAAGAVIPIHYLDASIMASMTKDEGVLEVHDALVLGIDNAEKLVKDYNEEVFNLSKDWNFVEEVYTSFTDAVNSETGQKFFGQVVEEAEKKGDMRDIKGIVDNFGTQVAEITDARKVIFDQGITVDHMVFTDTEYVSEDVVKSVELKEKIPTKEPSKAEPNDLNGKIKELEASLEKETIDNKDAEKIVKCVKGK